MHKYQGINKDSKKFGTYNSIGKGKSQGKGTESSFYKNGTSFFHKVHSKVVEFRGFCNRCDKDLRNVSKYHRCLHHKDSDRTNK